MKKDNKFQYDGRSRPSDDKYKENYDRIFNKKNKTSMTEDWISGYNKWKENPVAQEVRTPKYKLQVVKAKKGKGSYDRKQHDDG
jgi:stalled ribosome alternative rescue factor ArfA|tara:strand:+ start:906 stop:1157 length:252 start_codon:yes stop_codon:yes gene_type:complete